MINKKICLLGEYGVGKTSLVRRFVHDIFSDDYITTLGVKITEKVIKPIEKNGKLIQYRFVIWDIAGSEEGLIKHEIYWTGASGALIVTDLSRPKTFQYSKPLIDQFLKLNPDASLVIAGNKADLIPSADLNDHKRSLHEMIKRDSSPVFVTSAKTGLSVQKCFMKLAEIMQD